MESEAKNAAFGSYLKGFRTRQEMTIETVAEFTKIAVQCLRAIEQQDHDRLPPRPYVKSFIRSYARAVGADENTAVGLYLEDLDRRDQAKQQSLRFGAKMAGIRRVGMALGVIVGILLLLRFTGFFMDQPPEDHLARESAAPMTFDGNTAQANAPLAPGISGAGETSGKLKLNIQAVEETWLKVIVDGQNTRSYELKPEDRLELEGNSNFNLMIGNATGLKISLNDRPVNIFGSRGQVVSLKIP